jgi:hypothetical protein
VNVPLKVAFMRQFASAWTAQAAATGSREFSPA